MRKINLLLALIVCVSGCATLNSLPPKPPAQPETGIFTISTIPSSRTLNERRMDKFFQTCDWLQPDETGKICNLSDWVKCMGSVYRIDLEFGGMCWLEITYLPPGSK